MLITNVNDFSPDLIGKENMFFNADCMDILKKMPDKSVSLAIVDPPYGINITGRHKAKAGASPLVGGGADRSVVCGSYGRGKPQIGGITLKGKSRNSKCHLNFITRSMIAPHRAQSISRS